MTDLLNRLEPAARETRPRLVFPEGTDDRIVEAAARLASEDLAVPVLLGPRKAIEETAREASADLTGVEIIDPKRARTEGSYISAYQSIRSVSAATAEKILGNELLFGGLLVRLGEADGLIGGCVRTSGDLIAAAREVIGLEPGITVPSSVFVMALRDGSELLYADAAVNANPTAEELADIAVSTARSGAGLLESAPKVALLSFSTRGSGSHPDVEKVQSAVDLANSAASEYAIDGEFQADAALDESIARRKIDGDLGPVAGQANTLVFPDLDAGNIAYKLTQELAGASAYGPILQGFAEPVSDLSRGATVADIVGAAVITATLVEETG
ncbi:phosphate acyltransferase [Halodesulfurarchaeum sp. HSR-GB]|uniref:phosphate acyltransferase n=1 Tax=Halodesulfurarchaeum sp. HSR-GB TaxID=3074077 RepID=UPI00285AB32E|nr:phosphate acyltransferase [Halodesulfurarchaeum sp. HSR-GB]MDR5657592.1 phosphate acyltransferase [Halodesulfurarchaeum sp. HSR-GB]